MKLLTCQETDISFGGLDKTALSASHWNLQTFSQQPKPNQYTPKTLELDKSDRTLSI